MPNMKPDSSINKQDTHDEHCAADLDLYLELQKGIEDIAHGNTRPFAEAMADVKVKRSQ